ncbi:hypothetical protein LguiA_010585 [Lonicera macranthoides]
MVMFQTFFSIVLPITIAIFSTPKSLVAEAKNVRFSVDLIHRDSPKSPFYNPSLTPSQRVTAALLRSLECVHCSKSASTEIIPDNGEFLMKIYIGTPPVKILAIADTGSDLTWIQCKPCTHCFKQKAPLFSPNNSSTYKAVPCSSKRCHSLSDTSCNATKNTCQYSLSYGDKSFSYGDLSTETVTLGTTRGKRISLPNTTFGCGHENGGTLDDEASGIVGLGGGQVSLISQLGPSIGGKFSYCLVPFESNKSSTMYFGQSGAFLGTGLVSTPLVPNYPSTFYYITLEGITVGRSKRIDVFNPSASGFPQEGNIIIDSGTTLTLLPLIVYNKVESAVKKEVKLPHVNDPQGILSLCYNTLEEADFPIITMHFKGADLKLNPSNTFVQTGDVTMCLAFSPSQSIPVLGNLAQKNLLVGYDLEKKTVSFRPTDCEKE